MSNEETKKDLLALGKEVGRTEEELRLLMSQVAKGATISEFKMLIMIANKTGLDPFLKEIWYYKDHKNNSIVMTSRDGFLSIATRNPDYAGLISCEVREGDEFEIDYDKMKIKHKHNLVDRDKKKIIGGWAVAHKKGSTPVIAWVDFSEFNKGAFTWKTHPSMMIRKVAEVRALKNQYGIVGLVSREEMPPDEEEVVEAGLSGTTKVLSSDEFFNETIKKIEQVKEKGKVKEMLNKALQSENWDENQKKIISDKLKSLT